MQLISLLVFVLSIAALGCAISFAVLWRNAHRRATMVRILHEHIGHIGISAVAEYPDTLAPLLSLLEEEYPRSEAIIIVDLQRGLLHFGDLIRRYHLVAANHTHLVGVRALFRSRHRAYRRVVVVDLPKEYSRYASEVASEVATYDYIMHMDRNSVVARNAVTYCANIVAMYHATEDISLRTILGADVRLERCDLPPHLPRREIVADRPLAWSRHGAVWPLLIALLVPMLCVLIYHFVAKTIWLVTAGVVVLIIVLFLYISCCVVTEKSLFITLDTILRNFYRFLVEVIEKITNFTCGVNKANRGEFAFKDSCLNEKTTIKNRYDREAD